MPGGIIIVIIEQNDRLDYLPINDVKVSPDHLRKSPGNVNSLKSTIADVGLLQPIIVSRSGGSYVVIDGERRLRAMKELGISELIVGREVVIDEEETDADARFKQIIANIQRDDINPIDLGHAFFTLKQKYGYKYNEIAEIIGKTPHYVTAKVGLVKRLDPDLQDMVAADWYASKCIQDTVFADEGEDQGADEMSIKVIEDIARLPLELQKPAYLSIKSGPMGNEEALKYLKSIKKELHRSLLEDSTVPAAVESEASDADEVARYIEKIDRDVDILVTRFQSYERLDREDMVRKIGLALEKLSSLYSRLKSDGAIGGDKSQNKAIV